MSAEFEFKPRAKIPRRPRWVWLISSFYVSSGLWSLLIYYQIATGEKPLPASSLAHFANYSGPDFLPLMSLAVLGVIAGVLFVLLRKASVYVFALRFACAVILAVWQAMTKGSMDTSRPENIMAGLVLWGASAAVCFYAWHLMRKGVLK